jgi:hypothetical protein
VSQGCVVALGGLHTHTAACSVSRAHTECNASTGRHCTLRRFDKLWAQEVLAYKDPRIQAATPVCKELKEAPAVARCKATMDTTCALRCCACARVPRLAPQHYQHPCGGGACRRGAVQCVCVCVCVCVCAWGGGPPPPPPHTHTPLRPPRWRARSAECWHSQPLTQTQGWSTPRA